MSASNAVIYMKTKPNRGASLGCTIQYHATGRSVHFCVLVGPVSTHTDRHTGRQRQRRHAQTGTHRQRLWRRSSPKGWRWRTWNYQACPASRPDGRQVRYASATPT